MDEATGIDTIIAGVRYISSDIFIDKYFERENLFEGYVIGVGYVRLVYKTIPPSHLSGWSPEVTMLSQEYSHFGIAAQIGFDRSYAAIKQSFRGLFKNGEACYVVKEGDTIKDIAFLFDVTVGEIVKWNNLVNVDKIFVGQIIKIKSDNIKVVDNIKTGLLPLGAAHSFFDIYWNNLSKQMKQKRSYQIQKHLKTHWNYKIKTKLIKQLLENKILKKGGKVLGGLGLALDVYDYIDADTSLEKADIGVNIFVDIIGFTPWGAPFSLYWSLGGEWLHKKWRGEVLSKQIEWGIDGYASVQAFK